MPFAVSFERLIWSRASVIATVFGITIVLSVTVSLSRPPIAGAAIDGPLRVYAANPIYFTDNSGKAIRLSGHQIYWDQQDHLFGGQYTYDFATSLDWSWYLSFATSRSFNYVRGWTNQSVGYGVEASDPLRYVSPFPFARTGPGNAIDGRPKFDLTLLDQDYFDRMRSRLEAAQSAGIYVSIGLFDVFNFFGGAPPNQSLWDGNMFNSQNNVNGIHADTNGDGYGVEFFHSPSQEILDAQYRYIDRVIDTVNATPALDNVIYEIANEAGVDPWQTDIINHIRQYEATKPKQHVILRSPGKVGSDGSDECEPKSPVVSSSAEAFSLSGCWGEGYDGSNMPANTEGKPGMWDNDHIVPLSTDYTWPWKALTRGYSFSLYDTPFENPSAESSDWERVRQNIGKTATLSSNMTNLGAMSPNATACGTSYCLADPGEEYVAHNAGSSSDFTVTGLTSGATYSYEWYNPETSSTTSTGSITPTSSSQSFTPAYTDAVFYLRKTSGAGGSLDVNDGTVGSGENQFDYQGSWFAETNDPSVGAFNDDDTYSDTPGDYVLIRFTGTGITLFVVKDQGTGQAAASICDANGSNCGTETLFDTYASSTRVGNQEVFTVSGLSNTAHSLMVRVTGVDGAGGFHYLAPDRVSITTG